MHENLGRIGKIFPVYVDVRDETSVALAIKGSDAVSHYVEDRAMSFEAVHEIGALNVAHQSAILGIRHLVHISGIGADIYSSSDYVRARSGVPPIPDVFGENVRTASDNGPVSTPMKTGILCQHATTCS